MKRLLPKTITLWVSKNRLCIWAKSYKNHSHEIAHGVIIHKVDLEQKANLGGNCLSVC